MRSLNRLVATVTLLVVTAFASLPSRADVRWTTTGVVPTSARTIQGNSPPDVRLTKKWHSDELNEKLDSDMLPTP